MQDGNKAKFQEYRDLKTGVFGNMNFGGDNGSYYVDLTGENIGRDDQFFEVKGGVRIFQLFAYYNEIIHNLSFDAKTFYANPGSNNLTTGTRKRHIHTRQPGFPFRRMPTWNTFDYSIKRKDAGRP